MAISLTEISGSSVVAGSRTIINDNFTQIESEVNNLGSALDPITKSFDNSAETNGTVTTRQVTVTDNGVIVQNGNIVASTGNLTVSAGLTTVQDLTVSGATLTVDSDLALANTARVLLQQTAQEFASAGTVDVTGSPIIFVDNDAFTLSIPNGTDGQVLYIIHKGVISGTVTVQPGNFSAPGSATQVRLDPFSSVQLIWKNNTWLVLGGAGYILV